MTQPSPASARIDFIDYLKGVLIFLVAWGHLIQYAGYDDNARFFLDPLFKAIYTFHMPLFMAVSGYVSFHSISSTDFFPCIQKRFRQIILPAICWPVMMLVIGLLVGLIRADSLADAPQIFKKSLAAFRPGLWFLWAVFGSTVAVSALKQCHRDRLEWFAAALVVFLFAPDGADIYLFKYTFPFFCLGYALAKGDQIRVPPPQVFSMGLVVAICAASLVCYQLWNADTYIYTTRMHLTVANLWNISLRYVTGLIISTAVVLLAFGMYQLKRSRTLSQWGRRSLDIFIIHMYFLPGLAVMNNPLRDSVWFSLLAAPVIGGVLCFVTCHIGQGISRIPVARTFLLGQAKAA